MKIAIVTDWMTNYGGAESVISAFHDLFPEAPIYTTIYEPKKMRELGGLKDVRTTYLQKLPVKKHQWLLSLMPTAVEMMDLDEFDLVLSSCHSVSKGVITKPETLHISYCHTPMRYAWESWDFETRLQKFPKLLHGSIRKQIKKIRKWDYAAAQRVDKYVANSSHIGSQIKKYYERDSEVIYPPVHTEKFKPTDKPTEDYYFSVGRLIPYKKFDLLVQTFNELGLPLKIAGTGPDLEKLKAMLESSPDQWSSHDDLHCISQGPRDSSHDLRCYSSYEMLAPSHDDLISPSREMMSPSRSSMSSPSHSSLSGVSYRNISGASHSSLPSQPRGTVSYEIAPVFEPPTYTHYSRPEMLEVQEPNVNWKWFALFALTFLALCALVGGAFSYHKFINKSVDNSAPIQQKSSPKK